MTGYVYDDLGNLLEQTSPDSGVTSYTHDAAGNTGSMTDARGVVTGYQFDALNRLTAVTYPTSSLNRTYAYDGGVAQKGRLMGFTDASGTTAYAYNLHGERTGAARVIGGKTFSTGYGHDAAGQLTSLV